MDKLLLCLIIGWASHSLAAITADMSEAAIVKRIQPVGSVYVGNSEEAALGEMHRIAKTTHHEAPGHSTGKQVFENYCYICHQQAVANAPMFGNKTDWQLRANKGIATLVKHALDGYRYMPPRGTCLECSDEEIKAAVEYMVKNSS